MKNLRISATLALLGLAAASSQAATVNVTASGVYDEALTDQDNTMVGIQNNAVDNSAPSGVTVATFTTLITTGFSAGTAGVIDFNGLTGVFAVNDDIRASFAGGTKFVSFTNVNDPTTGATGELFGNNQSSSRSAISGGVNSHLSANTTGGPTRNDFEFTIGGVTGPGALVNEFVTSVGGTVLSRSGGNGTVAFTATLDDMSTIILNDTISDSNGGDDTFFGVTAPAGRYITGVKFDLSNDGFFTAIDDLGFTTSVIPEPSSALLLLGGLGSLTLLRRRGE